MTTKPQSRRWLFLVDERRGTLLRTRRVHGGRVHFDPMAALRNNWEEHQHGRPSPLAAKNGHTYASFRHEAETLRRRFADEVVAWIDDEARRQDIDELHVLHHSVSCGDTKPTAEAADAVDPHP